MNREERNQKISAFLHRVESGEFENPSVPYASDEDVKIARLTQNSGYVQNLKFESDMSGKTSIYSFDPIITEKGYDLMNNELDQNNHHIINQTINFHGQVNSPVIGNNNTITNNFNTSLADLQAVISTLSPEEQIVGNELLETIKTQNIKPGMFSKFTTFLEKHPKIVGHIGKVIVWSLSNTDKLPLL